MEQDEKIGSEFNVSSSDNVDESAGNVPLPNHQMHGGETLNNATPESLEATNSYTQKDTSQLKITMLEKIPEKAQADTIEYELAKESIKDDINTSDETDVEIVKKPKKKSNALKTIIYSFCTIAVSVILAVIVLFSVTDYLGMFRADKSADVKIPSNATTAQIASILKDNGIIRSQLVFTAYISVSKKKGFKSGVFTLDSQMSYDSIVKKLKGSAKRTAVKVTIPEGYTLQKIGALLEKNNVCTKQSFLTSADSASISFDFQSQIPNDKNRFYRLEGYLFPDTYQFYLNQSSDAVVKKMLANFDTRFDTALRQKVKTSGMTVDQIVTLASIIQTEAGKTSEMSKVSSVFHNRLKNGVGGLKMLQSDATIFYATSDIEPVLTSSGTQIASAYNTYKHEGLPPGAICNPGLDAINAALSPDATSYYFFVSDKSGKYYYAETYTEHLVNVKKALKTGEVGGTNVTS